MTRETLPRVLAYADRYAEYYVEIARQKQVNADVEKLGRLAVEGER